MSTVLLHEWLTNLAGSEKVVASLRRAFPGSPLLTTMRWGEPFDSWSDVHTTSLQRFARGPSSHVKALPLMPPVWRAARLPPAELYVTSFHTFALHARVPVDAPHLVYCHTPPRFIWERAQLDGDGSRLRSASMAAGAAVLGPVDRRRGRRPTAIVANSSAVAARIQRVYGREALVVHPPVDVARFAAAARPKGDHFLFFSRLVPYKRPSVAIDAFAELGWPLIVAGEGRARAELERTAPPNVRFVGRVDDEELPGLIASARALVYPGEEDFGIVPVEAMAAGTPVVALGRGGVLDTVVDGLSGVLYDGDDVASLVVALRRAAAEQWDAAAITASVERFAEARFLDEIRTVSATLR